MARTFRIDIDTTLVADYALAGQQALKAASAGVVRVFRWRDLQGQAKRLPKYVTESCLRSGFKCVVIGGTIYSHSIVGLVSV